VNALWSGVSNTDTWAALFVMHMDSQDLEQQPKLYAVALRSFACVPWHKGCTHIAVSLCAAPAAVVLVKAPVAVQSC
jgi:hypothetical protein